MEESTFVDEIINEILGWNLEVVLSDKKQFNADLIGKAISSEVIVTGESSHKVLPARIRITCKNCDLDVTIPIWEIAKKDPQNVGWYLEFDEKLLLSMVREIYAGSECPYAKSKTHNFSILSYENYIDYKIFYVKDLPKPNELTNPIYEYFPLHTIGPCALLPSQKKYRINAYPIAEPKTNNLALLAEDMETLHKDFTTYKVAKEDCKSFKLYFKKLGVKNYETIKEYLDKSIAPEIKRAEHAKLTAMLVLHSPIWVTKPDGERIRGWLRAAFYGDTRAARATSFDT